MIGLRLSMLGTLALIIGISTLFMTIILSAIGAFSIVTLGILVIGFNLLQWLFAPKLIDALYKVREVDKAKNPKLYGMVEELSRRMRVPMPKVMIAEMPISNAFAYGSPIYGNRVAVTSTLLRELEAEEVEAVIGHELAHLKHKDVQIMMFASVLPAIFYYIGFSLMFASMFGGFGGRGGGPVVLIGLGCMVAYWILTLLILGLSRLREYYADRRSVQNVDDGARKLSEALAKIVESSSRMRLAHGEGRAQRLDCFKTLFIDDVDRAVQDEVAIARARFRHTDQELVRQILARKVTFSDRLIELMSTHPNIVKRLRALQR